MKELRQKIRQQRQKITRSERFIASKKLSSQILKNYLFKTPQNIALYLPFDGEIETQYLITTLKKFNHKIFIPVLFKEKLLFSRLTNSLIKNRFGIKEPKIKNIILKSKINTVFMPLVAFDKSANRLGMGGGFYDKTFSNNKRVKLYGLAFDCQFVQTLKINNWDVQLNAVITPTRIVKS
ncbi:5-formyltetrahydrofolate cyclo-ligase [hydrothermal vent metagenome]|uniref:5-formyltetrahydrofolate cyclo-ligase n=1 Tax=hydrothermal vent metagenome TaxID=652676 RepID=A0A1W1C4F0_9ZZZZ